MVDIWFVVRFKMFKMERNSTLRKFVVIEYYVEVTIQNENEFWHQLGPLETQQTQLSRSIT